MLSLKLKEDRLVQPVWLVTQENRKELAAENPLSPQLLVCTFAKVRPSPDCTEGQGNQCLLSICYVLELYIHLLNLPKPWQGVYCYPSCAGQETESQRDQVTYPEPPSKWQSWKFQPSPPGSKALPVHHVLPPHHLGFPASGFAVGEIR